MSTDTETTPPATVRVLVGEPVADGWKLREDPLVAASYPSEPPKEWFENPKLAGPTMLVIEDSGRVYGHAADWKIPHLGLPGRYAPKSRTNYRYFLSGNTKTAEGDVVRTGHLTVGGGHADLQASAADAKSWYDDVSTCFADVTCGEDEFGWWVAGALRPDVTPSQVRAARGSSLSGDWRPVREGLEAVAAHAVNTPGFGIPQPLAQVASAADGTEHVTALIAAGMILPHITIPSTTQDDSTAHEEDAAMAKTDTTTKDTVEEPEAVEAPVAEEEATSEEQESHPAGNLVSIRDGEFVGLVADTDTHDPATVAVQIEVPRELVAAASPEQRALVSSAVQQKMRDRELDARFSELAGRVTAAESAAEKAWSHARGVEAMSDLDGII